MAWITPIVNWLAAHAVTNNDLNRIEGNTKHLYDNKVNNSRVLKDVPADALFTDTITTINGKTGAIAKADIVALGIPAQDTNTITTINGKTGAILKEDIVALGIPAQDTNTIYTHPTGAGNNHIPSGGAANNFLQYSSSGVAVWSPVSAAEVGIATKAQAEAGVDNTLIMTALRVREAMSNSLFDGYRASPGSVPIIQGGQYIGTAAGSYTKVQTTCVGLGGTYRVKFGLSFCNGQIYVNGVARGTSRANAETTYVDYTEDITVNAGDEIQLYVQRRGTTNSKYATMTISVAVPYPSVATY